MENVKNVADVPQIKPKKKFCFAIIPLIVYGLAFVSLSLQIYTSSYYSWDRERTWVLFFVSLFIHLVSIILLIIFVSKKRKVSPVISIPFIGLVFANILTFFNCVGEIFENYEYYISQDDELEKHFLTNSVIDLFLSSALIITFLAVALYVVLAISNKNSKAVRIFSFVPALIGIAPGVIWMVHTFEELYYGMNSEYYQFTHFDPISHIIECSAIAMGVLLPLVIFLIVFCLWISKPYKDIKVELPEIDVQESADIPPATPSAPAYVPTPASNPAPMNKLPVTPVQNNIDKQEKNADVIRKYKELLDLGAITQEEFDEKKKEILNNK